MQRAEVNGPSVAFRLILVGYSYFSKVRTKAVAVTTVAVIENPGKEERVGCPSQESELGDCRTNKLQQQQKQ